MRVGLGSLILFTSIDTGQVSGIALGGFFTIISLLTDGVCCGGTCYNPVQKTEKALPENIEYEELDSK